MHYVIRPLDSARGDRLTLYFTDKLYLKQHISFYQPNSLLRRVREALIFFQCYHHFGPRVFFGLKIVNKHVHFIFVHIV